jgi:RNA polymerase sigma-70 factor (ECF subfamily)
VTDADLHQRFCTLVLPHLDAAYNLARWLTRNHADAEDVVQDACVRALRYLDSLLGEAARPWLLAIVRNTGYSWLRQNRPAEVVALDDVDEALRDGTAPSADEPLAAALRHCDREQINRAIEALPIAFREVLVMRELEDLSYRDIARIAGVPVGTVMSRLARARRQLQQALRPGARPVLHAVPRTAGGATK